jgi:hypothetical protein
VFQETEIKKTTTNQIDYVPNLDALNPRIATVTVRHFSFIPETNQEIDESKYSRGDRDCSDRLAQEQHLKFALLYCYIFYYFDTHATMSSVLIFYIFTIFVLFYYERLNILVLRG